MELLKKISLYIIVFFLVVSCAARKVNKSAEEKVVVVDSTSVVSKEVVSTQDNNIVITEDSEEMIIVPIDPTKDILVNGKRYNNVKLRLKKTKKLSTDTTKIKVSENSLKEVVLNKSTKVKSKEKRVDKKANYTFVMWPFLIVLLAALAYWTYRKVNKNLS